MIEKNDWRLQGQESYLAGVKLVKILNSFILILRKKRGQKLVTQQQKKREFTFKNIVVVSIL